MLQTKRPHEFGKYFQDRLIVATKGRKIEMVTLEIEPIGYTYIKILMKEVLASKDQRPWSSNVQRQ